MQFALIWPSAGADPGKQRPGKQRLSFSRRNPLQCWAKLEPSLAKDALGLSMSCDVRGAVVLCCFPFRFGSLTSVYSEAPLGVASGHGYSMVVKRPRDDGPMAGHNQQILLEEAQRASRLCNFPEFVSLHAFLTRSLQYPPCLGHPSSRGPCSICPKRTKRT